MEKNRKHQTGSGQIEFLFTAAAAVMLQVSLPLLQIVVPNKNTQQYASDA
jgi:hypothetical protein